jgi:hypothetical protein
MNPCQSGFAGDVPRLPLRYGLREEGRDRRKVGAAFIAVTSLVADNVEVDRPLQE